MIQNILRFRYLKKLSNFNKNLEIVQIGECNLSKRDVSSYKATITGDNVIKSPYAEVKEFPNSILPDYVFQNYEKWTNHIATECGETGRNYTYGQLRENYKKFATSLLKLGLEPGKDLITICLPNIPEFPTAFYGTLEAGLGISPVSHFYTADEILYNLQTASSKGIICTKDNIKASLTAKKKLRELDGRDIEIICLHDYDGTNISLPNGVQTFKDFLKTDINETLLDSAKSCINLDATTVLPFSSGTTGLPKGVCLYHNCLTANLSQTVEPSVIRLFDETKGNQQDTGIAIVPLSHIYGANYVMGSALRSGAKLITISKFHLQNFLQILRNNKNISLQCVPTILTALGKTSAVTGEDLKNLKKLLVGAAPYGPADVEALWNKRYVPFLVAYGLTESSPVLTIAEYVEGNPVSIGLPISNTDCKIIDPKGNNLAQGQLGEICFKGPQIMKGYHKNPEETNKTLVNGWLHTGDIGYFDDVGHIYIVDRIKELIKVKGFPVAPAELEEVLRRHPDVKESGVTSLKCLKTGEAPIGFVVPKDGQTLDETDIKNFVAERVSHYKKLAKIIVVDSIPKNNTGKVMRKVLKQVAVEMLGDTIEYK